ncbi:MAG: Abi-alpha family protein [Ruminococcus sp.]|nr:Abi-alpha family protein [Ruminococcus sp.]
MESKQEKNINISPIPEFANVALTNIADEPTKRIGSTLGDAWYLVFGGIGLLAEKRKIKYALSLKKYEEELNEKIERIPSKNRIEADTQIVAPALEASKYCVEKKELREMFTNLIASSINSEKEAYVHPIFTDIIKRLSYVDAELFKSIALDDFSKDSILSEKHIVFSTTIEKLSFSIAVLETLGLIEYTHLNKAIQKNLSVYDYCNEYWFYKNNVNYIYDTVLNSMYGIFTSIYKNYINKAISSNLKFPVHKSVIQYLGTSIQLTPLGKQFKLVCIDG